MTEFRSPKISGPYADRDIDCEMAVEDGILDLIERGKNAAWGKLEILSAIERVAQNTATAIVESGDD